MKVVSKNNLLSEMSFEEACKEAKLISKEEGVVQHVNKVKNGVYTVSDWFDDNSTECSFENGTKLNENDLGYSIDAFNVKPEGFKGLEHITKVVEDYMPYRMNTDFHVAVRKKGGEFLKSLYNRFELLDLSKIELRNKLEDWGRNEWAEFEVEMKKENIKEDHTKNPNDKYYAKHTKEGWCVYEGDVKVKKCSSKEEAEKYAKEQNKKQKLNENVTMNRREKYLIGKVNEMFEANVDPETVDGVKVEIGKVKQALDNVNLSSLDQSSLLRIRRALRKIMRVLGLPGGEGDAIDDDLFNVNSSLDLDDGEVFELKAKLEEVSKLINKNRKTYLKEAAIKRAKKHTVVADTTRRILMERAGILKEEAFEIEDSEGDIIDSEEESNINNNDIASFLEGLQTVQELEELYDGLANRMKQLSEKSREDSKSMARLAKKMSKTRTK